jgi:hypothetical protein
VPDRPDTAVPILLVVADSIAAATSFALDASLTHAPPLASPVVVATSGGIGPASDESFGHLVAHLLESGAWAAQIRVIAPSDRSTFLPFPNRSSGDRVSIDVADRAEHLRTVSLPSTLATAGSIVVANDLRLETSRRPVFAIGLWARYADWRERLGARLADARGGLTAEIALAVTPRLLLLADRWESLFVVVATTDQIAAELAGRALRPRSRANGDESFGPWEDPLVQRATELDLGVRVPSQIAIRARLLVRDGAQLHSAFERRVDEFAGRLGVDDVSTQMS